MRRLNPTPSLCLLVLWSLAAFAQQERAISGVVLDSAGRAIAGAQIEFRPASGGSAVYAASNAAGEFTIAAAGAGDLLVRFPGFHPARLPLSAASGTEQAIEIRLFPAPNLTRIVVSDAEPGQRIASLPAGEFALSRGQIQAAASLVPDDVLKQAPGFSLFRRTGSLYANPTSQGVSLRGLGAGSASRALVLLDGVPLNDPFGGWVYWDRVPLASIYHLQVFNGGASDAYGAGALGGVINIQTQRPPATFATADLSYGAQDTPSLSFDTGWARAPWSLSFAGQALRTDGYLAVAPSQRGPVDTPVGTGDLAGFLQLARKLKSDGRIFLRAGWFAESRRNGTPLQTNNTRIPSLDLGADWSWAGGGSFSWRLYGSYGIFNQNFSSVSATRVSESLTNVQRSPSQQAGFTGQWQRLFARKHALTAVFEARSVRGHSAETSFSNNSPLALTDAGGRQRNLAFLLQDMFQFAPGWSLTVGGRTDSWLNSRGFFARIPLSAGAAVSTAFPSRQETSFSPRISLLRTFQNGFAFTAAVYRAFRAPTLNELYRNFRVGNVVTNANSNLRPERLTGGEAAASYRRWDGRFTARGTFFWSDIASLVGNITLSSTPSLITRQRQNTGVARAGGAELSVSARLARQLTLSCEYILTGSTILHFPSNRALEGLWIAQVPRHQLNLQLDYARGNWSAGAQGRFVGKQFDDDQNLLPLASFFTLDAQIARRISPHVTAFLAAQNITNARYQTGRTPVLTIGPPVLARLGIRVNLPGEAP